MPRLSHTQYDAYLARRAMAAQRPMPDESPPKIDRESQLRTQVLGYCRDRDWIVFCGSTAHRTRRTLGEPDTIIFADGGRVFAVELKRPGGKLSTDQLGVQARLKRLGHQLIVASSLREFITATDGPPRGKTPCEVFAEEPDE